MDCRERILSNDYYDIITDFDVRPVRAGEFNQCSVTVENLYSIVYFNRSQLANQSAYFFEHRNLPKLYGLMQENVLPPGEQPFDPTPLIASGILQMQEEPLKLVGRGCVIVFIDTGIDYRNPAFRKEDGTTRLLAIWDQTIQEGTPPEGFLYGTEYSREEINAALQATDPFDLVPSRDTNGHGTNLAAVAAGSVLQGEGSFVGAAPEADIVVVKLKECKPYLRDFYLVPNDVPAFEETDLMLAVQYGTGFAELFQRPVVFCIGVGTNYGDHAGNSALSGYLSAVASRRSHAVVVCGGNEGNSATHYRGNLRNAGTALSNQIPVEVRVGENADGFLLQLWGNVPDVFTLGVRTPGGETIPPIRLGLEQALNYRFIYEKTRITIAASLVEPASGEELITLRIQDPTPGIWTFLVETVGEIHNGEFHMWLPLRQFMNAENFFLEPSPYTTLTEPAYAGEAITVSAYNSDNNSFYINSGRGFSRLGEVKPDLAAPGVKVSLLRGTGTGSGLSAALTAGAVAQFMQWAVVEGNNVVVGSREIKNFFIRGAARSFDLVYPNREWGYGRLDLEGAFNAMRNL